MKTGLSLALVLAAAPAFSETAAGISHLRDASDAARPLSLSIWYPTPDAPSATVAGNPAFEGVEAAPDGSFAADALPLVVLSHGGLRSAADSGAWLSGDIARAGFVVVEVNAPRPATAGSALDEIWQRPRDIRRAIDLVLTDPTWGPRIDAGSVSVAGFALGATAALSLGGAKLDTARYLQTCETGSPSEAPDCGWFAAQGIDLSATNPEELAALAPDARVRAVIAVNPEYPASLGTTSAGVDTLSLSLGQADAAGGAEQAGTSILLPEASAFDAFATCTPAGPDILAEDDGDASLCGTSSEARRAVHAKITEAVVSFLKEATE